MINEVLGCKKINTHYFDARVKNLVEEVWAWLAPLLSDIAPLWLALNSQIHKLEIYLETRYWLCFACSSLLPFQNQSILKSPRELLIGSIICKEASNWDLSFSWILLSDPNKTGPPLHFLIWLWSCVSVPKWYFLIRRILSIHQSLHYTLLEMNSLMKWERRKPRKLFPRLVIRFFW